MNEIFYPDNTNMLNDLRDTPITGYKMDADKTRWDLHPFDALQAVAEVWTQGLKKYPEHNWEIGMSWSRIISSMCRHLAAIMQGEDRDKGSGQLHAAHLAANALMLLTYFIRNIGIDDRFLRPKV